MLMGKREQPGPEEIAGLFDHSIKDVADPRVIGESPALNKAIMEYQSPDNVEKKEIFTFDSEVRRAPTFTCPTIGRPPTTMIRATLRKQRRSCSTG